MKVIAESRRAH